MEKKTLHNKENLLLKNKQPIKSITYQNIYELKDQLEQLASWKDTLNLMKSFFDNQTMPLNKKKVIREFHAQSKVFNIFYEQFLISIDALENKVENLGKKEKIKL
ncbi:hypothetical protein [Isobaculum melis]|uniref:Uncharacterized protein n=1 Tax=Isobaculum melis TaxID=142588 RepID=A0A1H9PQL4_9LACT|nr:hypothetical protein [Isobaculum melis]SER50418.1 hypothetical protein SAMN04488559_10170 [Isobaculum melis]